MKFSSKEFGMHLLTIVLLFCSIGFIIPDLSSNLSNYNKQQKKLASTKIEEREYRNKYNQERVSRTLIMEMSDETNWIVPNDYSNFWKEIQSEKNLNKEVTMYLSNSLGHVPVQLSINGKLIYDVNQDLPIKYLLIFMTIGMTIYSANKLRIHFKNHQSNI